MKEHDFDGALEHCKEPDLVADQTRAFIDVIHLTTIRHALRFAEKMMQEPSRKMIEEAVNLRYDRAIIKTSLGYILVSEFKAMRDQALKELGE